jgi:hypothetical protein
MIYYRKTLSSSGPKLTAIHIIKKHPGSIKVDYGVHLASHGNVVNISVLENCYLPAEFIARILHIENVVGSGSSTLFYLKSWLPDLAVHTYNDFDEKLLTHVSREQKKELDTVGLINRSIIR